MQNFLRGASKMNSSQTVFQGKGKNQLMVVGGGIAGMEAALTAANMGLRVYLVEKESAIGGVMAQLDKTFPTNECSM
jgi:heterodisulfide reductase subunit A